jgi:DNA-binding transcriptional LysR family regulator
MKIDTLGVQAFIAIADQGGFQRGAEALHITQAALSRRLQNLESFLGVKLVERTTRSVALTQLGRDFLPRARRLLDDLGSALVEIRETGKSMRGDVTIACIQTVGVTFLPAVVQRYAALYPDNRIRILDNPSAEVTMAILRREAEFGINMQGTTHPELVSVPLMKDRFVLVCRDDHPLARKKSVAWKELEPHSLILAGHESGTRPLIELAIRKRKVKWRANYEVQRSSTALGMVARGVGATIVPEIAVQGEDYPRLRAVPLVDPVISRTLVLLSRANGHLAPAAQALYDLMRSPLS